VPLSGEAGSPSNTMSPGPEAYLCTKWHLDPSSHLATIHGPKVGGCSAPFLGGARSPSNTMLPGPRPTSIPSGILIHPAIWPQQTLAENWGGAVPLWEGGAGSPSNTMCPGRGPPPCHVSSLSIQPFGHITPMLQTDRTGQWSDSIRRTILEMVAQKQMPLLITKQQRLHTLGQMYHHSVTSKY